MVSGAAPLFLLVMAYVLSVMTYALWVMTYALCITPYALRATPCAKQSAQPCQMIAVCGVRARIAIGRRKVWHSREVREIPCVARRLRWNTNKWSR